MQAELKKVNFACRAEKSAITFLLYLKVERSVDCEVIDEKGYKNEERIFKTGRGAGEIRGSGRNYGTKRGFGYQKFRFL